MIAAASMDYRVRWRWAVLTRCMHLENGREFIYILYYYCESKTTTHTHEEELNVVKKIKTFQFVWLNYTTKYVL